MFCEEEVKEQLVASAQYVDQIARLAVLQSRPTLEAIERWKGFEEEVTSCKEIVENLIRNMLTTCHSPMSGMSRCGMYSVVVDFAIGDGAWTKISAEVSVCQELIQIPLLKPLPLDFDFKR